MAIENGDPNAIFNLANCYDETENYEEAIKYYLMAIEKEKGDFESMNNLAICYQKTKNYEEAIKYYLMATENGRKI
jgi:TPR repeat protein